MSCGGFHEHFKLKKNKKIKKFESNVMTYRHEAHFSLIKKIIV